MILVVLGHCTYYQIATSYGGAYYQDLMSEAGVRDTMIHHAASMLTHVIYTFHMPLFMALSGAVFSVQIGQGKYGELGRFVKNKCKRLLVPFFVTALFVSIPLKYIAGYWAQSDSYFYDIAVGQILLQGNSHLWFLPTLFCEMMIFWGVQRYTDCLHNKPLYMLILLSVLCIVMKSPIQLLTFVARFAIWFYMGMLFNEHRQTVNRLINTRNLFFMAFAFVGLLAIEDMLKQESSILLHGICRLTEHFLTIAGMCLFYSICYWLWQRNIFCNGWLDFLAVNSLGIYLYSDPLNYVILACFHHAYGIAGFGDEYLALALYIGRFCLTFAFGIAVTCLGRRMLKKFTSQ